MVIGKAITALSGGGLKPLVRVSAPEGSTVTLTSKDGKGQQIPNPASHNLPSGWQEVEYIQSSGTQYIDTAFIPPAAAGFYIDFYLLSAISTSCGTVMGMRTGQRFTINTYPNNQWNGTLEGWSSAYNAKLTQNTRMQMSVLNDEFTAGDGTKTNISRSTASTYSVYISGSNNSGSLFEAGKIKIYNARFYSDNSDESTMVRNYIPCYCTEQKTGYQGSTAVTVPADTAGLYDLVNNRFYVNSASGADFTCGDDVPQYLYVQTGVEEKHLNPASHNLPDGYTELSYIQSSGSQFLNLGWQYSASKLPIEIKAKFEYSALTQGTVYGLQSSSYNNWIYPLYCSGTGASVVSYIGDVLNNAWFNRAINTEYDTSVLLGSNTVTRTVNGTSDSYSYTPTIDTSATLRLFAGSYGESVVDKSSVRVKSFSIIENGTLVMNLIPCKNSSNVVGMLDIAKTIPEFYANAGSGTFAEGAVIPKYLNSTYDFEATLGTHTILATKDTSTKTKTIDVDVVGLYSVTISYPRLPSGFQEVEYIHSNKTQYINTNYYPNGNIKVVAEIDASAITSKGWMFGNYNSGESNVCGVFANASTGDINHVYNSNWRIDNNFPPSFFSGVQELTLNKGILTIAETDGSANTSTSYTFTASNPLCIFTAGNGYVGANDASAIKLYSMQIYDGDMVRNFVPCYCTEQKTGYKGSTAVTVPADTAGLYDLVNNRFYVNSGSGTDFIVGEDV